MSSEPPSTPELQMLERRQSKNEMQNEALRLRVDALELHLKAVKEAFERTLRDVEQEKVALGALRDLIVELLDVRKETAR